MSTKTLNLSNLTTNEIINSDIKNIDELTNYNDKVLQYINLISPTDTELINMEYIFNRGHHYINRYKELYLPYIDELKTLTDKYYNHKKYIIEMTNKEYVIKNRKDETLIKNLQKPKIINVIEYLKKAKNIIQRQRSKLTFNYNSLLQNSFLNNVEISKFKKKKDAFVTKLNEYYAIQYYYNRINLQNNLYKRNIVSTFKNDKMFYDAKLIPEYIVEEKIAEDKEIRNIYLNNTDLDKESIKEYLTLKKKMMKKTDTIKEKIEIILLEEDLITKTKFNFFGNNKLNNK